MKIIDAIRGERPTLSVEVFPPKSDDKFDAVRDAVDAIAAQRPSYMSVTCGAGGSNSAFTARIAAEIREKGVTPLAHLTCVAARREDIRSRLEELRANGVENVLALRGDLPEGMRRESLDFAHASDLMAEIRAFGGFCVGGACYPEGHPESESPEKDVESLRIKQEAGCAFLTTQMFFDNRIFYGFLERARRAGVAIPVIPGIMPVTNAVQIRRICALSGTELPDRFRRIVERFGDRPESMRQAGIVYAAEQIIDLYANGVNAVHLYSMNKPEVSGAVRAALSEILA